MQIDRCLHTKYPLTQMFIQFPIEKCVLPSPTGCGPAGMRGRPSIGRSTQVWCPALCPPLASPPWPIKIPSQWTPPLPSWMTCFFDHFWEPLFSTFFWNESEAWGQIRAFLPWPHSWASSRHLPPFCSGQLMWVSSPSSGTPGLTPWRATGMAHICTGQEPEMRWTQLVLQGAHSTRLQLSPWKPISRIPSKTLLRAALTAAAANRNHLWFLRLPDFCPLVIQGAQCRSQGTTSWGHLEPRESNLFHIPESKTMKDPCSRIHFYPLFSSISLLIILESHLGYILKVKHFSTAANSLK